MSRFAPVVDTRRSAHARLKPISLSQISLRDRFWRPRRDINRRSTLPSQAAHIEATGRLANFRRAAGTQDGEFEGLFFNDSDVHKWLEALASTLAEDHNDDGELRVLLDGAARDIVSAQEDDGFLMSYFSLHREGLHPDHWAGLDSYHQLYCMGHFLQAAIAHWRATDSEIMLGAARRVGDCLDATFGEGKKRQVDGHPEIEMALVELFRATGDERFLDLAGFFVDVRGHGTIGGNVHSQDNRPLRERNRLEGHAVCALYLNVGATDVALETGEPALWSALEAQWDNFIKRQMFVTGGAGSRWAGESFGSDFQLPNERAYAETCAAIALVMWAWRMGQKSGDARFFDVLERTLYNGILSGLSLGGDEYFYQNPLANDGTHRRQKWFGCACCPPNIARLLAQMPGYFYSVCDEGIWAHLFAQNEARLSLLDGREVVIEQHTDYPWQGEVRLQFKEVPPNGGAWTFRVRVPDWARGATLFVNGEEVAAPPGTYAAVSREWQSGDEVRLVLPMTVEKIAAHRHVLENTGRVALRYGPLVYCLEGCDNPDLDLRDVEISPDAQIEAHFQSELLGGVVTLHTRGECLSGTDSELLCPLDEVRPVSRRQVSLMAVPYFAWANRAPGQMQIWLRCHS